MTPYEAYQYASMNIRAIDDLESRLKRKEFKREDLAPLIQAKLTPEYRQRMQTVLDRALPQVEYELKQWYE